jgi:hypothetical protein
MRDELTGDAGIAEALGRDLQLQAALAAEAATTPDRGPEMTPDTAAAVLSAIPDDGAEAKPADIPAGQHTHFRAATEVPTQPARQTAGGETGHGDCEPDSSRFHVLRHAQADDLADGWNNLPGHEHFSAESQ